MRICLVITTLLSLCSLPAFSQTAPRPVSLPQTDYWEFTSAETNRPYAVYVALPESYAAEPTRQYPVLYMTDAHMGFPLTTYTYRLLRLTNDIPEMLIVGMAGQDANGWVFNRRLELTPTRDTVRDEQLSKTSKQVLRSGDAARFARVFEEELFPQIERRYRATAQRTFVGHSFGGLFGTVAMLERPQAFQKMILVSPSLGWHEQAMFAIEARYAESKRSLPIHVYMTAGGLESAAMVDNMERFGAVLAGRKYQGLTVQTRVYENTSHTSVFPPSLADGLRILFPSQASK